MKISINSKATPDALKRLYPNRIVEPDTVQKIPRGVYMVYILTHNNTAIVVGHGKHNRAKVIFDDKVQITTDHIKAIFVMAYRLFGTGTFQRFFIVCDNKNEAKEVEKALQAEIGGNSRDLPEDIQKELFKDIPPDDVAHMVLRMALSSSFSGISDLRKWRKDGILTGEVWGIIQERLKLEEP